MKTSPRRGSFPPKIILVSHESSPSTITGAEKCLLFLAQEITKRGFSVEVVMPRQGILGDVLFSSGIRCVYLTPRNLWLVHTGTKPLFRTWGTLVAFLADMPRAFRLLMYFRNSSAQLLHVNTLAAVWPMIAAYLSGIPVIWHIHEFVPEGWRRRFFALLAGALSTRIVAVSKFALSGLREYSAVRRKSEVVYNGTYSFESQVRGQSRNAELSLAETEILLGHPLVGYVGQVLPRKGMIGLLDSLRMALDEESDIHLIIAGHVPDKRYYREVDHAIRKKNLTENVHFLGFLSDPGPLYVLVDCVVIPSSGEEAFPMVALEVMAAAKPVIAYNSGGIGEIVSDGVTGVLVEHGKTKKLAEAILYLLHSPGVAKQMGIAAKARIQKGFSLAAHAEAMCRVYRSILGGSIPPS